MLKINSNSLEAKIDNFALLFFKFPWKILLPLNLNKGRIVYKPAMEILFDDVAIKMLTNSKNADPRKVLPFILKALSEIFDFNLKENLNLWTTLNDFINSYLNTLKEDKFQTIEVRTMSNLAVGLGIPAFFENGLTFHHIYGVPYLPGSSVKGLLRYAFWGEALGIYPFGVEDVPKPFELLTEDEGEAFKVISKLDGLMANSETFKDFKKALSKKVREEVLPVRVTNENTLHKFYYLFVTLFGTQKVEGKVIFADALAEEFKLGVDIMNPHFKDYYQSEKKEYIQIAEIYNPVPIQFLVVEKAKFAIPYKITAEGGREILEKIIEKLLREAFDLLGIGAKRRKGYGRLGSN